ncbi:ribonuclease H-like domain-containing protein [Tanacetum coccineum]|uniref:Ribonuclease H-like domain-containing protein n=1 Tax=Tanacetum coccineum TaxID=301880 RepID=A0ABQ5BF62_9ASTR
MSASQEEILTNHTTSTLITKHQPTNSSYCINHQAAILKGEYDSMGYERALFTEIVASEKREKSKGPPYYGSLPEDNLAKLHKMTDEKRCNSLKDSLYPTKKAFTKVDETVQSLLSQLEIHGVGVSTEDANKKFLRSLPSAWSQVSLIMRTKPGVDSPSFDDFIRNDHEDLEQIDEYDLEEMDLKWQVAMISMRMKKFYKKTGRKLQFDAKEPVGFDKTKVECYNCHKTGHFARECRIKGTQDNRRRDAWNSGNKDGSRTVQKEDSKALVTIDGEGVDWTNHSEDEDYALMACNSSDSDTEREQLSDASIEIKAYSQGLKKVEAQLVAHQQGANYDHRYDGILSYENEVLQSVFMNKESEIENQPLYDRFVTAEGMHAVPPPMTGNYMPSGPDVEIDDSKFTYGPKQTQPSESESQSSEFDTCESNISAEPSELVSEPVVNESKVECQPKVWFDAPIIEEYESDSEDECVSILTKQQETPSFANQQVKTHKENVKSQFTLSQTKVTRKILGQGLLVGWQKAELNNGWNNVQRVNKQNQFVPSAVLTRTGIIPVNTARTRRLSKVNSTLKDFSKQKVNTTKRNAVSTVGGKRKTAVKPSAGCDDSVGPRDQERKLVMPEKSQQNEFARERTGTLIWRVLVTKLEYKSPYELLTGKISFISLYKTFWDDKRGKCHQERKISLYRMILKGLKRQERRLLRKAEAQVDVEHYLPVSTASPYEGLSLSDPTNPEEDDSEIPPLEDIYQNSTDDIFTTSSYDDEGASG